MKTENVTQFRNPLAIIAMVVLASQPVSSLAAASIGETGRASNQPNPLKNVYFGEQHLHTSNSPDAFALGERGSWDDAYNYAKGKPINQAKRIRECPQTHRQ